MTTKTKILCALGVTLWTLVVAVGLSRLTLDTQTGSFLPNGDRAYSLLEGKERAFGGDPIIVLLESERPRELFLEQDELLRLLRLEGALSELPDVAAVYGPATVLNQTAGAAQDMLAQISGRRDAITAITRDRALKSGATKAEAEKQAQAALRAFDRRYGALMVKGMPAGLPTLRNSRFVQTVLFTEAGDPRPRWQFIVPSSRSVAVLVRPREALSQDAAGDLVDAVRKAVASSNLPATTRSTVTGTPAIAAGLSDRARTELPLLGAAAVVVVGLIFVLVPWTPKRRSRLRPLLSALAGTATTVAAFGWIEEPLSLGVVAFLPIMLGIGSDFPLYLSREARVRPVLVAATAAAIGFASLAVSPLPFVRQLAIALAIGIVATIGIALMLRRVLGRLPSVELTSTRARESRRGTALAVLCGGVIVAALGWVALPGLPVASEPERLAAGLPELKAARHAEELLGSSGEVSILIRGSNVTAPEVLAWADAAETAVVREFGDRVHPVLTLGDLFGFLGAKPSAAQAQAAMDLVPRYLSSAVVTSDSSTGLLIFGVEFDDVDELGKLLAQVRAIIPDAPAGVSVDLVGLPVTAVQGLDLISSGRVWMNLIGILAAAVVILLGLRSLRQAALATLTVLLATGWIACLVSVTSASLNPLTVAIGSLITATGCEFFLMMAARGRDKAVSGVVLSAMAGVAGYAVLAFSGLGVLRNFGILLAASVAASYLSALVVHRAFQPRAQDSELPEQALEPSSEVVA